MPLRDPTRAAIAEAVRRAVASSDVISTPPGGVAGSSSAVGRIDPATGQPQTFGLLGITPLTETDAAGTGGFRFV